MNPVEQAVREASRPVALTGAGISAPSGIPTFQGTWKGRPIRDFLSREYMTRHRAGFFELFCEMVNWCEKQPNAAHRKLAEWGLPIITQNIDGLHHRAGGGNEILELHGSLRTVKCASCGRVRPAKEFADELRPLYAEGRKPDALLRCDCGGLWDTDVVLYGDAVRELERAFSLAQNCDLMLVVGTSLSTYPAASLPDVAREAGARVILINEDCVRALTQETNGGRTV